MLGLHVPRKVPMRASGMSPEDLVLTGDVDVGGTVSPILVLIPCQWDLTLYFYHLWEWSRHRSLMFVGSKIEPKPALGSLHQLSMSRYPEIPKAHQEAHQRQYRRDFQ